MNQENYVFAQFNSMIVRYEFDKCVNCYNGDNKVKDFSCWCQFLSMVFGQLTHGESIRNIIRVWKHTKQALSPWNQACCFSFYSDPCKWKQRLENLCWFCQISDKHCSTTLCNWQSFYSWSGKCCICFGLDDYWSLLECFSPG